MNLCKFCQHGSLAECPAVDVSFAQETDEVIGCDQFLNVINPNEEIAEMVENGEPNPLYIEAMQTQVWYEVPKDRVVESDTGMLFTSDRDTNRVGLLQYNRKTMRFLRLGPNVAFWLPVAFPQPPIGWRAVGTDVVPRGRKIPPRKEERRHGGWNDSEF